MRAPRSRSRQPGCRSREHLAGDRTETRIARRQSTQRYPAQAQIACRHPARPQSGHQAGQSAARHRHVCLPLACIEPPGDRLRRMVRRCPPKARQPCLRQRIPAHGDRTHGLCVTQYRVDRVVQPEAEPLVGLIHGVIQNGNRHLPLRLVCRERQCAASGLVVPAGRSRAVRGLPVHRHGFAARSAQCHRERDAPGIFRAPRIGNRKRRRVFVVGDRHRKRRRRHRETRGGRPAHGQRLIVLIHVVVHRNQRERRRAARSHPPESSA